MRIEELTGPEARAVVEPLAELLHACVHDGASIGYILPFEPPVACAFWEGVADEVARGLTRMFVAREAGEVVGVVLLQLAMKQNQQHRATVAKLLVHPNARRRGTGRALMVTVEAAARQAGRVLLILDTRTGDPSEALYRSVGFSLAGVMPAYARHPIDPVLEDCSLMYKHIA
ncbi:GNAT family N-acetyltransferase [Phenylobacterium sp.]|uniref:GNAT family N-acetyltransferase n=1 Tax=Phenylobacterium sp. TaxID=1871053 RepID=UPI002E30F4B9|nr:GNAT family N-acetyltransferase [Phenylobacterium sp.]HEX2561793.1 GNAT family N-acetyltransferase [Phenylobacterium sp.]